MAIIVLILLLAELKATMYLPKVVAASHFPPIVVIRSLTYLLTCRALTVAVMYVHVCNCEWGCVFGSFVRRGAPRLGGYCTGRYPGLFRSNG